VEVSNTVTILLCAAERDPSATADCLVDRVSITPLLIVSQSNVRVLVFRLCRVRLSRSVRLRDALQDVRTRSASLFSVVVQHI